MSREGDVRDEDPELFQPLLRSLVLGGLLRAPAATTNALVVHHSSYDPDRRRLRPLVRAVRIHPLDGLALLLEVLIEQGQVPDARCLTGRRGRPSRVLPGMMAGLVDTVVDGYVGIGIGSGDRREAVLDANAAVGLSDVGMEEGKEPVFDAL